MPSSAAWRRAFFDHCNENARELGGLVMQDGSLPAYLEKALAFTAGEQERMKQKYLR